MKFLVLIPVLAIFAFASTQQGRPDPATLIAAQKDAMKKLSTFDGVWRGEAWSLLPDGSKVTLTQTERVGPFLDGSVRVFEGRGYGKDGKVVFNAFATISFNPNAKTYGMHSYAQGNEGQFVVTPTEKGYIWEIPAGPMIIRYTATNQDGVWKEVGERIMPGQEPTRIFEMTLKRIGSTDWPSAGAVPMK